MSSSSCISQPQYLALFKILRKVDSDSCPEYDTLLYLNIAVLGFYCTAGGAWVWNWMLHPYYRSPMHKLLTISISITVFAQATRLLTLLLVDFELMPNVLIYIFALFTAADDSLLLVVLLNCARGWTFFAPKLHCRREIVVWFIVMGIMSYVEVVLGRSQQFVWLLYWVLAIVANRFARKAQMELDVHIGALLSWNVRPRLGDQVKPVDYPFRYMGVHMRSLRLTIVMFLLFVALFKAIQDNIPAVTQFIFFNVIRALVYEDIYRRMLLRTPTLYQLVTGPLSDRRPDPVFMLQRRINLITNDNSPQDVAPALESVAVPEQEPPTHPEQEVSTRPEQEAPNNPAQESYTFIRLPISASKSEVKLLSGNSETGPSLH